jgi:hypothetical protein
VLLGRSSGVALSVGPDVAGVEALGAAPGLSLPGAAGESADAASGAKAKTRPTAVDAKN